MAQQIRNQTTGGSSPAPSANAPAPPGPTSDRHTPTEKSFIAARDTWCTALENARKDHDTARKAYDQSVVVYEKRKHLFEWTERNYRLYRDLDLCLDTELTTGNASLTTNVANYNTLYGTLYNTLSGATGLTSNLKKLKALVVTLRDRASDLENYKNDQSNATQWSLLTGENVEKCNPPIKVPKDRPDSCRDTALLYNELIAITRMSLVFDIDYLIQSSADVTGIHTFSNVAALTTLQGQLSTASTNFVQQIQKTVAARSTDLKQTQTDLVTAAQDCTKAGVDNFNKISIYSGAHHTVEFLCDARCGCAAPLIPVAPEARLRECECRICRIGEKVKVDYPGAPPYVAPPPTAGGTTAPAGTTAPTT
jgi:hypothetical protein